MAERTRPTQERDAIRRAFVLVAAATLAGLALRWMAARGDLALDEIWSLRLALEVDAARDLFTTLRHDNNHPLSSLWLRAQGLDAPSWRMRLPAVLAGAVTVAAAGWIAWSSVRERTPAALRRAGIAASSFAFSFFFVHYGSEARGYALAGGFGLAAVAIAIHARAAPRSGLALPYGVLAALAMWSHAVALHLVAGVAVWTAVLAWRRSPSAARAAGTWLWWNGLAVASAAALLAWQLRALVIGGGYDAIPIDELALGLAATAGLPLRVPTPLALAFGAVVAGIGFVSLVRRASDLWWLYAVAGFVSPLGVQLLYQPEFLYARYLYVSFAIWLLLAAEAVATIWERAAWGRWLVALAGAGFLFGNILHLFALHEHGRGRYTDAIEYLLAASPAGPVVVTSDHDFRNSLVLSYHASRVSGGDRLVYVPLARAGEQPVDWVVLHDPQRAIAEEIEDAHGRRYRLLKSFSAAPLSGFTWRLYRHEAPAAGS